MCGVVRGRCLSQEFRRMHHDLFREFLLYLFRHAREHGGFDDCGFAFAYEPDRLPHNGVAETVGSGRCRYRDENDVAVFYLVFIFAVRLF